MERRYGRPRETCPVKPTFWLRVSVCGTLLEPKQVAHRTQATGAPTPTAGSGERMLQTQQNAKAHRNTNYATEQSRWY